MKLFRSSKNKKKTSKPESVDPMLGNAVPPSETPALPQQPYHQQPFQAPPVHGGPPGPSQSTVHIPLSPPPLPPPPPPPPPEWLPVEGNAGISPGPPGPPGFPPRLLSPNPTQHYHPPPNIVVNQHYYITAGPPLHAADTRQGGKALGGGPLGKTQLYLGSVVNLATDLLPMNVPHFFDDGLSPWHASSSHLLNQGAAFYDQLSSKFDNVLTSIDRDRYTGNEGELFSYGPSTTPRPSPNTRKDAIASRPKETKRDRPSGQTTNMAARLISGSYFARVDLYANSKLPPDLPPVRLYISTYPLLSLAARYSNRVYQQPRGAERFAHIDADWRAGTKAMVIKSVSMDNVNTIVFAIRGTATFMDWAVNLNMAPTSPVGFLDDLGNFCHAGFLSVARRMIRPVAARLRQLLEEDPSRASYSLLITGHSAGGAVAALLYSHMLATSPQASSELNSLTDCFHRIHCVTFGTPPVSLLPLTKPDRKGLRNSLFLSFVNEGDPVVRADKAYVKSLLDLFSSPAPAVEAVATRSNRATGDAKPAPRKEASTNSLRAYKSAKSNKSRHDMSKTHQGHGHTDAGRRGPSRQKPVWKVPPSTLSNAGRLIVLRSGDPRARLTGKQTVEERLREGVVAQFTTDEQLRGVIWGDPVCHVMSLYASRIETLAIGAVMVDE
ncbi:lipase, class 3 [Niveomyces insectorum RCEF 264]|uniref:Lipase, class 3 n=1 Tax=Niveomyces insectorum RCEF 264 TaxID=1081102 RepID=A0A167PD01_9HYPO|nr:lipase, class 3 [Niveomyces insectorum RCEF 264]